MPAPDAMISNAEDRYRERPAAEFDASVKHRAPQNKSPRHFGTSMEHADGPAVEISNVFSRTASPHKMSCQRALERNAGG
jgi:hypothetical protein